LAPDSQMPRSSFLQKKRVSRCLMGPTGKSSEMEKYFLGKTIIFYASSSVKVWLDETGQILMISLVCVAKVE